MMRATEALVFLCLATGLHAAVWTVSPVATGAMASGGSGRDTVSVEAATASQQEMIAEWQNPPDVATQQQDTPTAPTVKVPSVMFAPNIAPAPEIDRALPQLTALSAPSTPFKVDTMPAARPKAINKPVPKTRPQPRPVTQPSPEKSNQPKRQAEGASQQAQKGTSGQARAQAQTAQRTHALRAQWGSQIHAKVHRNMRYPRRASATGTAKLALTLASSGKLQGLQLVRSSGDAKLDDAAVNAVRRAGRFAKAPQGLPDETYTFSLSLTFDK